jgi:putative flippase GtrA
MWSPQYIFRNFFHFRLVKYLVVGGTAAVTDISLFAFFTIYFGMGIATASVVSFLFAVVVNYYLGILIIFDSKVRFRRYEEFSLVFLVSASGLLLNIGCTYLFVHLTDFAPVIAKVLAALPTLGWNYTLRRNFIFKQEIKHAS